jgi:hypothetical protein
MTHRPFGKAGNQKQIVAFIKQQGARSETDFTLNIETRLCGRTYSARFLKVGLSEVLTMISQGLLATVAIVAIYSLVGAWIAGLGEQTAPVHTFEWSSSYGAAGLALAGFEGLLGN